MPRVSGCRIELAPVFESLILDDAVEMYLVMAHTSEDEGCILKLTSRLA